MSQVSKVILNINIVQGIILYCFNTEGFLNTIKPAHNRISLPVSVEKNPGLCIILDVVTSVLPRKHQNMEAKDSD